MSVVGQLQCLERECDRRLGPGVEVMAELRGFARPEGGIFYLGTGFGCGSPWITQGPIIHKRCSY
jgi:hypothetical protein